MVGLNPGKAISRDPIESFLQTQRKEIDYEGIFKKHV